MDCEEAQGLGLELFLERGELTAAERCGLDAHLAGCAECRRVVAENGQMIGLLRGLPRSLLEQALRGEVPDVWAEDMGGDERGEEHMELKPAEARSRLRRPMRIFALMAAVAACLAGSALRQRSGGADVG